MKGALWPQLPPSQERPYYCPGLPDKTRIMSYKGAVIVQVEHPGCVLSERWQLSLLITSSHTYFKPYIVHLHPLKGLNEHHHHLFANSEETPCFVPWLVLPW